MTTEDILEGTEVLERLAQIGKVDEFFEAVDEDNFSEARRLMKKARVDQQTIDDVLRQMSDQG